MLLQLFIILLPVLVLVCCQESAIEKKKEYYRSLPPVNFSLAKAEKSDVIYKYFNGTSQKLGTILTEKNVTDANLNKTIPTILLLHGWTTDDTSPWFEAIKNEYFELGAHNIIYINWSKAGNKTYRESAANVKPVGEFIAQFLIASGVPQQKIHVIGHSLGSHLASFTGKSMFELSGKKLDRITALDPAGPKFENLAVGPELRLADSDADFVDVVHTSVQLSGYTAPVGHVDFYPNEGRDQPGCPPRDKGDNCDHLRAAYLFVESLSKKSKAWEATFENVNNQVTVKVKNSTKDIIFGEHVNRTEKGVFYFETNDQKPFLK